jgi:hypothetical protein
VWSEQQRAALSKISEADRQQAAIAARQHMTGRYKSMLDTEPDDSDWEWAAALGLGVFLFRGRRVPPATVAKQLDRVMAGLGREANTVSQGKPRTNAWGLQMARLSKTSALVAGAFAVGGWGNIDLALPDVEASVLSELDYLNDFADGVDAGQIPRDGRFLRRAMLYATAGYGLYMALRGAQARWRGYHEERNVLDPAAEHCIECVDETAKDWQPLGTLTPIGRRQCLSNCRCRIEFRNRAGKIVE